MYGSQKSNRQDNVISNLGLEKICSSCVFITDGCVVKILGSNISIMTFYEKLKCEIFSIM